MPFTLSRASCTLCGRGGVKPCLRGLRSGGIFVVQACANTRGTKKQIGIALNPAYGKGYSLPKF